MDYKRSTGIVQLLKSKNISTIGDLCSLPANKINELPFKTPKCENVLKVLQTFNKTIQQDDAKPMDCMPAQVEGKNMGSLEEEMARLEEAHSLDTSIECENQMGALIGDNEEEETETCVQAVANDDFDMAKMQKFLTENLTNVENNGFNLSIIDKKIKQLKNSDLLTLLNYVNKISMRVMEVNNCILQNLSQKNDK
jgi:hypothetical protein